MKGLHKDLPWFFLALLPILYERFFLLSNFGFLHADDDQVVMWFAAKELLSGRFNEVLFYGQDYASNLEAWMSVPFIYLGMDYEYAFPLITSLLAICPFLILSFYSIRRKEAVVSLVPLLVFSLLPVEYGMITSIPRGFVSGIFLASWLLVIYPNNPFGWLFVGYWYWISLKASANALPFLLAIFAFTLLKKNPGLLSIFFMLLGCCAGLVHNYLIQVFIERHPENQVHFMWRLTFDFSYIRINDLLHYFDYLSPIVSGFGWIWWLFFGLSCWLLKKHRHENYIACGLAIFTLLSFALNKTHHGYENYSFSHARMFLYLPVVFALIALSATEKIRLQPVFILVAIMLATLFKIGKAKEIVAKELAVNNCGGVHHEPVKSIQKKCSAIDSLSRRTGAEIILVGTPLFKHFINYACPCILDSFPVTMAPLNDRRGWYLKRHQWVKPEKVLILFTQSDSVRLNPSFNEQHLNQDIEWVLVDKNKEPLFLLASRFGLPFRSNRFYSWDQFQNLRSAY